MRTKTITIEGQEFVIRALKRGETKRLRSGELQEPSRFDDLVDQVLGLVLAPEQFEVLDGLDNPDVLDLYRKTMDLTYGTEAETKNS